MGRTVYALVPLPDGDHEFTMATDVRDKDKIRAISFSFTDFVLLEFERIMDCRPNNNIDIRPRPKLQTVTEKTPDEFLK